jgi:penicillin-binding protein 1B
MVRLAVLLMLTGLVFFTFSAVYLSDHIEKILASNKYWDTPSYVYSDSTTLYPGIDIDRYDLINLIHKLNYKVLDRTAGAEESWAFGSDELSTPVGLKGNKLLPGECIVEKGAIAIYLHDFFYPERKFKGFPLKIRLDRQRRISEIINLDNDEVLASIDLEPVLITRYYGPAREERDFVPLREIPKDLRNAVISIEDRHFYDHHGVDFKGIIRAMVKNFQVGRVAQGGSTITQQLIKNMFLTTERSFVRKIKEAILAPVLELTLTKDKIFELYLNEIYLGSSGSISICGVEAAANFYFGKSVRYLTLPESALLAGVIQAPNTYNPRKYPDKAKARRNVVLGTMQETGSISAAILTKAQNARITTTAYPSYLNFAPYFVEAVGQELAERFSSKELESEGLRIFTTLRFYVQSRLKEELIKGIESLEKNYPQLREEAEPLQGMIIIADPHTGNILGLAGGLDFYKSQFNRATMARRQPGSLMKPLVTLAGFQRAQQDKSFDLYPSLNVADEPYEVKLPSGETWRPKNYDGKFHGEMSLRQAFYNSYNIPFVKLGRAIGLPYVVKTLRQLGIDSPLEPVPSLPLGSLEVTPLELIGAYTPIFNNGFKPALLTIKQVITATGTLRSSQKMAMTEVVTPEAAALVRSLMTGVMEEGTGQKARRLGFDGAAAGKTGTTSDYKDAWFLGYSGGFLSLVWIGYDNPKSLHLTASNTALPIWVGIMKALYDGDAAEDSEATLPDGLEMRSACQESGQPATNFCKETSADLFFKGRPNESCELHK